MGDINLWALIVVKLSELGILKRYIYSSALVGPSLAKALLLGTEHY